MSCSDLDRLMNTLRVKLPGIDDDALKLELFNVVDDHCRKTNAWRETIEVTLETSTLRYPIIAPNNTTLVRVMDAMFAGSPVSPMPVAATATSQRGRLESDELFIDGDAGFDADAIIVSESNVFQYAIYYPTYLTIDVSPSADAVGKPLTVIAALTLSPKALACDCGDWSVPEWMWERYFNDWMHGTLSAAMATIAKPYTNTKLALYHAAEYRRAKAFARQEAFRGFVFDRPMWRYPSAGGWIK